MMNKTVLVSFAMMEGQVSKRRKASGSTSTFQFAANNPCEDALVVSDCPLVLGVFDGHNGAEVSRWAASRVTSILRDNKDCSPATALRLVDDEVLQKSHDKDDAIACYNWSVQGAAAALAVIRDGGTDPALDTAVLGDSRIVVNVKQGTANHVVLMGTHDHNAKEPAEQSIVEERLPHVSVADLWVRAGGVVYLVGEVQTTRALGDHYLKNFECFSRFASVRPPNNPVLMEQGYSSKWKPLVSCEPDEDHDDLDGAQFILLGSDGLFELVSSDLCVHLIDQWGRDEPDPASRLGQFALNVAAMRNGMTLEALLALEKGGPLRACVDDISIIVHWLV